MTNTLWALAEGASARLSGFSEALDPAWLSRLRDLGFEPGEEVACVTAPRFGAPRTFRLSNSFFSVERTIAECVLLELARE